MNGCKVVEGSGLEGNEEGIVTGTNGVRLSFGFVRSRLPILALLRLPTPPFLPRTFYARLLRMQQNLPLDTNFTHLNVDSGQNGRDEILRGLMKVRGIVWMLKVG